MLRISKMTDYGVVLATHLAGLDGPRSVRALAGETGIPQPTAAKVLKALGAADLVVSTRGALGGYALARSAGAITIGEVITALEGPIAVTECTDDLSETACMHETNCGVRANWQKINEAVESALSHISLADMARSTLRLVTITSKPADRAGATDTSASASVPSDATGTP